MIKFIFSLHLYSIVVVVGKHFVTASFLQQVTFLKSSLDQNYTRLMMSSSEFTQCKALKKDLSEWEYAAPKLLQLPIEMIKENFVRRNIKNAVFSLVLPTPLKKNVKLVAYSDDVLTNILDMDPSITEKKDFADFIAGNKILDSSTPLAHRYGGHQFGVWAQQLGDGRAHLLGEYINHHGEHWELQLKGSGMTPYSRGGDGRAVLRSSIREFLCSEAMHYLGVPTSRAAALVVSEDLVQRDMFYRGNMQLERAAVVLRLAPTWFRFGSFEILTRNSEFDTLKLLVDYIIQEHFPDMGDSDQKYVELFTTVAYKTMDLVVMWESIGFTHGVLNTDNMSLLGITIDYGPFGFVEAYDPLFVPNNSDNEGRYAFIKQPEIALWNLERLSFALGPLWSESDKFQIAEILSDLMVYVQRKQRTNFCLKLGLELGREIDYQLVVLLMHIMEATGADFTATFSQLGQVTVAELSDPEVRARHWALEQVSVHEHFPSFLKIYAKRLEGQPDETRMALMQARNPRYVLKNWMAQSAIARAEDDDFEEVNFLLEVLRRPFTVNEEAEKRGYSGPTPKWARNIKVSCSS